MTTSNTITKNDLKNLLNELLPLPMHTAKIGEIIAYAGNNEPLGWLKCDGRAVSRTTYSALFSVIGTTYGTGDGSTTFNLPDLRDRFPVGAGTTYDLNDTGGEAEVTLTTDEIPAHTHGNKSLTGNFKARRTGSNAVSRWGSGIVSVTTGTPANVACNAQTGSANQNSDQVNIDASHEHNSVGGGLAHENLPPYIALNYLIYAGGDFAPIDTTPPMDDWIIEQGTSGIWTYRKWNSGISECWGRTGIVTPTNGAYSVAFPTGLFIRVSHLSVNPYYGEQSEANRNASKYIVTDGSNNYNTNTTDYAVAYVRDYAGNAQNPYIAFDFHAYGTWK